MAEWKALWFVKTISLLYVPEVGEAGKGKKKQQSPELWMSPGY